ncbi:MAG: methionine--tRNA ligase subunit beta [Candidatus Pacearchaeota archaeon]|jgi:methionyl-tRNA synthetase
MSKELVSFSDWEKIDLRNAEILEVEEIKGADKLYKLKIDLGTETRTLVAGVKPYYTKDELIGKRIIIFANLEPRTIKGIKSQGMVLAVSNEDHSEVKLLQPDGSIELGNKVS